MRPQWERSINAGPGSRVRPASVRPASVVVRGTGGAGGAGLRVRTAPEREQMVADRANLRFGAASKLRVVGLRVVRPELRHARAGQNLERLLEPLEDPVRLQPLG